MPKRRRKRLRRQPGVVRRLLGVGARGMQWGFSHPQPVLWTVLSAAVLLGVWRIVTDGDAFKIRSIEAPSGAALEIPDVRGQSIWLIDLAAFARSLNDQQPQLKWVRVVRVLPHTLRIQAQERRPLGQVQLSKWHPVDDEGFVFTDGLASPSEDLVRLTGVAESKAPLKAGRVNEGDRLKMGLRLAGILRDEPALRGHEMTEIDVGDPRQLSFMIDGDIEIRCGSEEELSAQMDRLRSVMQRVAQQAIPIRYIDVRFPDPVIGPKT